MDRLTKKARSENMAQVKNKNTKPEVLVRKFLFSKGLRFRKNDKRYPGCPDIVLPKYKTVIFVNGCFWHCHENFSKFTIPKTNVDFWKNKLDSNKKRGQINHDTLIIYPTSQINYHIPYVQLSSLLPVGIIKSEGFRKTPRVTFKN